MTFHYRYRKQILLGILLLFVLGGSITFGVIQVKKQKPKKKETIVSIEKKETKEKKEDSIKYTVDIKGQINGPGIYEIEKGKRVIDVIALAGGLTEYADTSVLNLSKKVTDEMVIIIYSREEVSHFKETKEQEKAIQEKCVQKEETSLKNDACILNEKIATGKISINTATKEELKTLSGIGDAKAEEIISYREEHGPFQSIEEIMNVPGIGESRFAAIKEDITL